ncbi:MAG: thiamine phosphate synthase [Acidobacteria bacterium]|nr:thiamine phosphate synthase [Acidobacteriota bacterium]
MPVPADWPSVYAILDADVCRARRLSPGAVLQAWLDAGITLVQLRAKSMGTADVCVLGAEAVALTRGRARLIVNDRADVAQIIGADGVHVGQDDLPPEAVRALLGSDALIGLSTHSLVQAQAALRAPIDYLAIGPVFDTGSKDTGYTPLGLPLVRDVCALARARSMPVVAIGGITVERTPNVVACGVSMVCAIGALLDGDEPGVAAARLIAASR